MHGFGDAKKVVSTSPPIALNMGFKGQAGINKVLLPTCLHPHSSKCTLQESSRKLCLSEFIS